MNTTTDLNAARGLHLDVFRPASGIDCTANGISSRHDTVTLVGIRFDGYTSTGSKGEVIVPIPAYARVFAASEKYPAVVLVVTRRVSAYNLTTNPTEADYHYTLHLAPVEVIEAGKWSMFGGNLATTGDSRLNQIIDEIGHVRPEAINIHDRVEI